jgi:hypothetical protein
VRAQRIVYLEEAVRQLQQRYEVADDVMAFVYQSLALVNLQSQTQSKSLCYSIDPRQQMSNRMRYPRPGSRTKIWGEILSNNPKKYLRLSFSLDYALTRGQFPDCTYLDAMFAPHEVVEAMSAPSIKVMPMVCPAGPLEAADEHDDYQQGHDVVVECSLRASMQPSTSDMVQVLGDPLFSAAVYSYTPSVWN